MGIGCEEINIKDLLQEQINFSNNRVLNGLNFDQYYCIFVIGNLERFKFIEEYLNENMFLIDIGCNDGSFIDTIKILTGIKKIYGLDINKNCINFAKSNGNLVFVSDIHEISIKPYFFDFAILSNVFEHLYDNLKALNSIRQILKINGLFYVEIPKEDLKNSLDCGHKIFFNNKNDFIYYFENNGFNCIKINICKSYPRDPRPESKMQALFRRIR